MEIYLDANATTPVLPIARDAALAAMSLDFGNPSSTHSRGLQAKSLKESVRAMARRVLGAHTGQLLFVSGATEGIQTVILSALTSLKNRQNGSEPVSCLLYGATEHKAVPEALMHWNTILGLNLEVRAIPVGQDGRHDLDWLHQHVARAGLVCTMAANNETGVISDLPGIAKTIAHSDALWMVDGVQALGKLSLQLQDLPIDYAPFSGHKLYAPKGIGLLYIREDAPFTPLIVGGGQEGALRSGTENMTGIAALGAILSAIESHTVFHDTPTLNAYRSRLMAALRDAFDDVVFNVSQEVSLPTTINFSVPGVGSNVLLNLFDAAGVRVSGGSACGAAKAKPSYVLEAMGLPEWQIKSAIRMSFGPADTAAFIEEACVRILACGESLRRSGMFPGATEDAEAMNGLTRLVAEGACSYIFSDAGSKRCVVIDPRAELTAQLLQRLTSQQYTVAAILTTTPTDSDDSPSATLRAGLLPNLIQQHTVDTLGWPVDASEIAMGDCFISRVHLDEDKQRHLIYLVRGPKGMECALVGDTLDQTSSPSDFALRKLTGSLQPNTLLLPGHDHEGRLATTLAIESAAHPMLKEFVPANHRNTVCNIAGISKQSLELDVITASALIRDHGDALLLDVREAYEQCLSSPPDLSTNIQHMAAPLSQLPGMLPELLSQYADRPLIFFCRSGNRSEQAARALRQLGHPSAWSLAGGVALWNRHSVS